MGRMPERLAPPPETLVAAGITLRRWRTGDVAAITVAVRESRAHLATFLPWAVDGNEQQAREFLERSETGWREGTEFNYGVYGDGRQLIGSAGLMSRQGPGVLEIGYWVHVRHTRRGVATRAAAALTAAGLAVPGIELIEIHHHPDNVASGAVPRRLGFTRAGERVNDAGQRHVIWQLARAELAASAVPTVLDGRRTTRGPG
jgi:ribosomal-protein-serine acetyltransferase